MTLIDLRSRTQRVTEDQDRRRSAAAEILDWIAERPNTIHDTDLLPLLSEKLGHPIELIDLERTMTARFALTAYITSGAPVNEHVWDILEAAFYAALDRLLDVRRCGECDAVIPHATSRLVCNDKGLSFCDAYCHSLGHACGPCDAAALR